MIYYSDNNIVIRDMAETDPIDIYTEEIEQGHHRTVEQFNMRLKDREKNIAVPLVAEYNGKIAGYVNVYMNAKPNPYVNAAFYEIIDFGVFGKYRRHGIGSKLMDVADEIVAKYDDTVYLSVGLHSGYGSAQRMYIKRGYIPDGLGVKYGDAACIPYQTYCIDDDLVLGLSKKL
jgi:ribosomal protein S18 acetylase RimI-like enzyme